MKRMLLELGGKGACLVLDDAHVKGAVGCIGSTWSFHSGQICTAPTRAIVHGSLFDQVLERLAGYAGALKVGDPTESDTVVGPLISAAQRDRVEKPTSPAGRGRVPSLVVGWRPARVTSTAASTWSRPCSSATTTWRSPARRSSGPSSWSSHSTTRRKASPSPTTATSGSTTTSSRATRPGPPGGTSSCGPGHVGINTAQRNHEAPFGGFKMSGVGRDGGDYGLEAYSEMQSIVWSG